MVELLFAPRKDAQEMHSFFENAKDIERILFM